MKKLLLFFLFLNFCQSFCNAQSCDNWLSTPSVGSAVNIGDLDITGNRVTIEATINRTTPYLPGGQNNSEGDIVSKYSVFSDINYLLRPNHAYISTTNGFFGTPDICNLELNKTYHVAMVYDGNTLKFYRNGYLMSKVNATGNLIQNNWNTRIGLYESALYSTQMIGFINEVRIWNIARTQEELRSTMSSALPNPSTQPGLLAYYRFDNLLNKQGNTRHNGALTGSASIGQQNPHCALLPDSCSVILNGIGGIINEYTPVSSLDVCSNKLVVEDATKFRTGDTIMLIQMKGAVIDSTNTAAFGSVINYNNAGNYEFNYVKNKSGNTIELQNMLTRQYDVANGKVQVVRVPYYENATIMSTLTCLPWDGNKGGILVLNVKDNIILNADIDVSGKGFRGGNSPNPHTAVLYCSENGYSYPAGSLTAAAKGESIATVSSNISWGKGALANGGGSGLGHNSGGGGGSNGGVGGLGGYQLESCGNAPFDNRGIGGNSLVYNNTQNKIFMGGGGGAGHTDNAGGTDMNGGNGGGIVIIRANGIGSNGFNIIAKGADAPQCSSAVNNCYDGNGGGGGGGTILVNSNTYSTSVQLNVAGGKGADLAFYDPNTAASRIGPGGGGGGGVAWLSTSSIPANVTVVSQGGLNGVIPTDNNNPWGATAGNTGFNLLDLKIPLDDTPFTKNIVSVTIKDSALPCNQVNFNGIAQTSTSAITQWRWDFGDNSTANTQTATHGYAVAGNYLVKLVATDINGCADSATKTVVSDDGINIDFSYKQDICNSLSVQFFATGTATASSYWDFGDGNFAANNISPTNIYAAPGNYVVKYGVQDGSCADTVTKTISLNIIASNLILTQDTTICLKSSKQLLTIPALSFCWTPTTYLNDPLSPNPITSSPEKITYYFTAEIPGNNLITNGSFDQGNTGFSSQYNFAGTNNTEGEYFVGANPQAWNASFSTCKDHTNGGGNMMLVNGAPVANIPVWTQTVTVTPNTNYAFSTWIQALYPTNPAQLSFSINGSSLGNLITASLPTCTWDQFYTTWNSGSSTTAVISIVNKNILVQGNDFALDDILFSTVLIQRDSVTINVDSPSVRAGVDTSTCQGQPVQLSAAGAVNYSWLPSTGLDNAAIPNPIATPNETTQYIVTGTNNRGCTASDTVNVFAKPLPIITKTADSSICGNTSVQLFATGGVSYLWSPAATLNNPNIPNPIATPTVNTTYHVTVTAANTCSKTDSVKISIAPPAVFTVSPDKSTCLTSNTLSASGGNSYLWSPAALVNDPTISNPVATTNATTTFTVKIKDNVCNDSATLTTTITILQPISVSASKSNDIDCVYPSAQLTATGGNRYVWSPATGLNNSNIANPIATVTAQQQYVVTGTDSVTQCSGMASITLFVKAPVEPESYITSAFSPNGDGLNDCFRVNHFGTVKSVDVSIYNRWGKLVYHSSNVNDCWDGIFKGAPVNAGNYVYYIKTFNDCGSKVNKGTLMLIR